MIPELFPDYGVFKKVVTEFGSSLNAKVSQVKYAVFSDILFKFESELVRIFVIYIRQVG